MTQVKHTPGPWDCVGEGYDSMAARDCWSAGYAVISRDANGEFDENICLIDEQSDDAVAFANARLIAAAPDLLAALKDMNDQYARLVAERYPNSAFYGDRLLDQARAAIVKAEGGSS